MSTIANEVFAKTTETFCRNLTKLQESYLELLNNDEETAYTEVGFTLRAYVEALALINNAYTSNATEEEAEDELNFDYE